MKLRKHLSPVKNFYINIHKLVNWFFYFFIKSPRFELYVKRMNKLNSKYFKTVNNDIKNKTDIHLKPYYFNEIPKFIWIYWEQGEKQAPFLVKSCINRWRNINSDWEVIILNKDNLAEYINLPKLPNYLPVRYQANLLRTMLLNKYGGVWVDATTYCHRPLSEWLPLLASSGFFMFSNPAEDRDIENWFIASTKSNPLIDNWRRQIEKYYLQVKKTHPAYFITFYIYQWMLMHDDMLKTLSRKASTLNAAPCFLMKSYLLGNTDLIELQKHIENGLPLSKLDWRLEVSEEVLDEKIKLLNELQVDICKCNLI